MKHKEERFGELVMIAEVLLHAAVPVALNYGAKLIPQLYFIAWVTFLGSFLYFLMVFLRKQSFLSLKKQDLVDLSAYTLLIAVVPYGLITYFTRYTDAISTTLFAQTEVIFAFLVGWLLLGERLGKFKLLGMASILIGNLIVLFKGSLTLNVAGLIISLAPLSFAFGNLLAKRMQARGIDWSLILAYRHFLGGCILFAVARVFEPMYWPTAEVWPALLIFSLGVLGLGKILWQVALHRMDLSKVTAIGMTSPVASLLIAFLWLKEVPDFYQWGGILFTFFGVAMILQTKSKQWLED